jgi:8-oxo-dGTP pyrophosphatase MutT (NUDIX family)
MANYSMNNIVCSGALFYAKNTKRFLFLLRNNGKTAGTWGIVGGKQEDSDATTFDALKREIQEEIGFIPDIKKTIPLEMFVSKDEKFFYHTYLMIVENEFIPVLNNEHSGWAWSNVDRHPKPLHQGLKSSFSNKTIRTKLETIFSLIDIF